MSLHICFVTSELFPGTGGGIGRLISAAVQRLIEQDWRITILSVVPLQETDVFRRYAAENLKTVNVYHVDELLNDLSQDEDIPLWGFHFSEYYLSYRVAIALRRLCRKYKFDGIEFPDFPGLGYVTLKWRRLWGDEFTHIAIWIRLHGSHELCDIANNSFEYSNHKQTVYAMERYCLQNADGWIGPSESVLDWYKKVYCRLDVPTVISVPSFDKIGAGNTHPRFLRDSAIKILYFSKLQRLKGIDTFIRAAIKLCEQNTHQYEFEIVGMDTQDVSGQSYIATLERMIPPNRREYFHFHGHISLEQMSELIESCTVAVIPSRVETFCLAAHELNWMGIPLILNDIPAFEDYFVDQVNCRKFDGTPEGLYNVLMELLSKRDPFSKWEWNASEIVHREQLAESYSKALDIFHSPKSEVPIENIPLVSVIVPYYEMQQYIDDTVNSVKKSNYRNWELILVDDGSLSVEAQEKFGVLERNHQDNPQYRFFRKQNGGLGSARNYGIQRAKGKYILPLDSDDVIEPDYIELGVKALERQKDLAAVSCFVSYFRDGEATNHIIDYVIPYDLNPLLITLEDRAGVACSIFRREVFQRFSYREDLTAFEDWELWWQLAEAGIKSETLPKILYRYRRHQNSMFNQTSPARAAQLMNRIAELHSEYLHHLADDVFRVYVAALAKTRVTEQRLREEISENNPNSAIINQLYIELNEIKNSFSWKLIERFRRSHLHHRLRPIYLKLKMLYKKYRKESIG